MKCPNCENQNKPGVKNCEFCNSVMPIRKKRTTSIKIEKQESVKQSTKKVTKKTTVAKTKTNVKASKPKTKAKVETKELIVKEPLIELSDEKKALKKLLKRIKKINKMIYVYIIAIVAVLGLTLMFNNKVNTVTCTTKHSSEIEKYSITLKIKKRKNDITNFQYITKNTTNSYDDELESRYKIIIEDIKRKDNYKDIVSSSLSKRGYEISYKFNENYLDKTSEYIGIDLTNYKNDVNSFIEVLEKEVGFICK